MKIFLTFLVLMFTVGSLPAQELNCQVTIIEEASVEVSSVEREIINQLKQTIYDFMNNTKWTKDKFKVEERINCQIQFQINKIVSQGNYEGFLQVQSTRPAFNSTYNTTMFNYQDEKASIVFNRNSLITYAPNQYRDNLTSMLAFYAYFILGMDYDSYSMKGGTTYFTEAQSIVSNAMTSGLPGWQPNEPGKRNRYWLVDNALQQLFEPMRECNYEYHRLGLDQLSTNPETARKAITAALQKMSKVTASRPNSINVLNFTQAKSNELKNLFELATPAEKTEVVTVLKRIDPANSSKYEQILN